MEQVAPLFASSFIHVADIKWSAFKEDKVRKNLKAARDQLSILYDRLLRSAMVSFAAEAGENDISGSSFVSWLKEQSEAPAMKGLFFRFLVRLGPRCLGFHKSYRDNLGSQLLLCYKSFMPDLISSRNSHYTTLLFDEIALFEGVLPKVWKDFFLENMCVYRTNHQSYTAHDELTEMEVKRIRKLLKSHQFTPTLFQRVTAIVDSVIVAREAMDRTFGTDRKRKRQRTSEEERRVRSLDTLFKNLCNNAQFNSTVIPPPSKKPVDVHARIHKKILSAMA